MKEIKKICVVMVVVLILASCSEKGGTIEIYNDLNVEAFYTVVKGEKFWDALKDLDKNGTLIKPGETKEWTADEDGIYTVVAIYSEGITDIVPKNFNKMVTLLGGSSQRVKITKD